MGNRERRVAICIRVFNMFFLACDLFAFAFFLVRFIVSKNYMFMGITIASLIVALFLYFLIEGFSLIVENSGKLRHLEDSDDY